MSRLRLAELPAMFWVLLAGRESRAQLRFILACRREASRVRRRARIAAAVDEMIRIEAAKLQRELPPVRASSPGPLPQPRRQPEPGACKTLLGEIMRRQYAEPFEGHEMLLTSPHGMVCVKLPFAAGDPVEPHELLWVEGRGRVCLTCESNVTVSVNGTILQIPLPGGGQT